MSESSPEALDTDREDAAAADDEPEGNTGFQEEWTRLRDEDRGLLPKEGRDDLKGAEADTDLPDDTGGQDRGESEGSPEEGAADQPGPAADETADIWANADPALREAFEAERKARERAENHNRSQGGRLSTAERRLQDAEALVEGYRKKEAEAPKGDDSGKTREERLAALREEYPDLAVPLLEELDSLKQQVSVLSGRAASESRVRTEAYLDEQETRLEELHPGWLDETKKPEWAAWVKQQPAHILESLSRNGDRIVDHVEAADVFDRYLLQTGKKAMGDETRRSEFQERRGRQLEAGRTGTPRTPSAAPAKGSGSFGEAWNELRDQERREEARAAQGR